MDNSGVYKIINLINDKCYVGGSVNLHKRKLKHLLDLKKNRHHNEHLQRSYNKYGRNNFKFEIIETCNSNWNEIEILENKYIKLLNPEYNLIKKAFGINCAEITRRKLSETHKKIQANKSKELRSSYFKYNYKPVIGYNLITKEIINFENITKASEYINCHHNAIRSCLNNNNKQRKGFIFTDNINNFKVIKISSFNPVEQYDLNNNFIKLHSSIIEAAKYINKSPCGIHDCLNPNSIQKTCGGFKWKEYKYYE